MLLSKRVALAVAGVAAAAVVGTAGVAAATAPAAPSSPSPTASSPGSAVGEKAPGKAGERRAKHRLLARGMRGEFVVKGKDGKPVTVVSIRGEVTAVSATSITIKAEDGFSATYAITAETKLRGKGADKVADIKPGTKAAAVGPKSPTPTAQTLLIRK